MKARFRPKVPWTFPLRGLRLMTCLPIPMSLFITCRNRPRLGPVRLKSISLLYTVLAETKLRPSTLVQFE